MTLKIDSKKLLIGAGKAVVDLTLAAPVSVMSKFVLDGWGASDVGKKDPTANPEDQAVALIKRSLARAVVQTIRQSPSVHAALSESADEISASVDALEFDVLTLQPYEITSDGKPWVDSLKTELIKWLKFLGIDQISRDRLVDYFVEEVPLSIQAELRRNPEEYEHFLASIRPTIADDNARHAQAWRSYRASLAESIRTPLFRLDEDAPAVSLEDIYVPLRASHHAEAETEGGGHIIDPTNPKWKRRVVWLEECINEWSDKKQVNDPIRFISGEPGSGKSSFARMFAANLARRGKKVMYIPLHRVNFHGDAKRAIAEFANLRENLGFDLLSKLDASTPTFLIIDGLDELSKADDVSGDAVRGFVENLDRNVRLLNNGEPKLFCLIAGRPLATSRAAFDYREPMQRLEVLRYSPVNWCKEDICELDQRHDWWTRFGAVTGRNYDGLPETLRGKGRHVDEITSQPLLNYLLSQVIGAVSDGASLSSVHDLYRILFDEIRKRPHRDPNRPKELTDRLDSSDYDICLEEVSVIAWKTGDRTVKIEDLEKHFEHNESLNGMMNVFNDIREGLLAVLDSFYISTDRSSARSFEFTHKSFREYLTSRRIVRLVNDLANDLNQNPRRFRPANALREWAELFGDVEIDDDTLIFVRQELHNPFWGGTPDQWKRLLVVLLEEDLSRGIPVSNGELGMRHVEAQSRNAEVALLFILGMCSEISGTVTKISWPYHHSAQTLLRRVLGPNLGHSLSDHRALPLSWIDFREQILVGLGLQNSNLSNCNFAMSSIYGGNFVSANLRGANFTKADLANVNFRSADVTNAIFVNASLRGARIWKGDVAKWGMATEELVSRGIVIEDSGARRSKAQAAKLVRSQSKPTKKLSHSS